MCKEEGRINHRWTKETIELRQNSHVHNKNKFSYQPYLSRGYKDCLFHLKNSLQFILKILPSF